MRPVHRAGWVQAARCAPAAKKLRGLSAHAQVWRINTGRAEAWGWIPGFYFSQTRRASSASPLGSKHGVLVAHTRPAAALRRRPMLTFPRQRVCQKTFRR